MEVDATREMFERSEPNHGVKYVNYIGDGDTYNKTYNRIVVASPYGPSVVINKTECANLLQRCVGGFTQNSNKSLNNIIRRMAPKIQTSSASIVKIAASIAACTLNEDTKIFVDDVVIEHRYWPTLRCILREQ